MPDRKSRQRIVVLLLAALAVGPVPAAEAAGAKVALGPFVGRRASYVRGSVRRLLLRAGYSLVSWRAVVQLRDKGSSYTEVAAKSGIVAFVTGSVRRAGRRWRVAIRVRGADGATRVAATWRARRSRSTHVITRAARRRLLDALAGRSEAPAPAAAKPVASSSKAGPATPPAPRPSTPAPRDQDHDEPLFAQGTVNAAPQPPAEVGDDNTAGDDVQSAARRQSSLAVQAALGLHFFTRRFSYNDVLFGGLRPQNTASAGAVGGTLAWYPAAHFTTAWPARIGLTGRFRVAFAGVGPFTANGVDYPASAHSAGIGLRARHQPWRRLVASADVGFGVQALTVEDVEEAQRRSDVPGVELRFLHFGGSGEIRIWRGLSISAKFAYLAVLDAGELAGERFFPRATAGGVETGLAVTYALAYGLAARIGFDLRYFFISFNPEPGDRNIAGGAIDQYLTFTTALVYRLRWRKQ